MPQATVNVGQLSDVSDVRMRNIKNRLVTDYSRAAAVVRESLK